MYFCMYGIAVFKKKELYMRLINFVYRQFEFLTPFLEK